MAFRPAVSAGRSLQAHAVSAGRSLQAHRWKATVAGHQGRGTAGQIFLAAEAKWEMDHLVYAVNDLQKGIEHFQQLTGIEACIGGRHKGLGTHNAIFSLGNSQTYFEIIAPDPTQRKECPVPRWMGMDSAPMPRLLTWAVRLADREADFEDSVAEITATSYDPGPVSSYQRRAGGTDSGELLEWSLAYNHETWPLPGEGLIPFLIDWELQSLKRVNEAASAAGACHFVRFEAQHPHPQYVQEMLECLGGVRELAQVKQAAEGRLFCVLDTPNGIVKV